MTELVDRLKDLPGVRSPLHDALDDLRPTAVEPAEDAEPTAVPAPTVPESRVAVEPTVEPREVVPSAAITNHLITPPTDEELFSYLGPQARWVQWFMSAAFIAATFSLARFASNAWYLWPLFGVIGLNLIGMVTSALSGWNYRDLSADSHWKFVQNWMRTAPVIPTVDVFLPTCGESMEVLENTYTHVSKLLWPVPVKVWVLDDADRPEVADAARRFGYNYIVRPNRGHMKKAGNLQYAFSQTSSDVIAIFDADFCPRPDYLMHLVPYMATHDHYGILQSPQFFSTTPSMTWLERTAGATQELFYRWVQPSRDAVGGAICVGTCAIYRRAALESINGFAQIEHSEDVHTGIFLLRAGFQTKYVPIVASKGLCPDELAGFINQQYRWCNGSITLLRSGQAQRRPLTFRQRLCFWSGFLYYITTAVNVFTIHIPGIVMAVFYPDQIRATHFVPFLAGVWVYFVLLPTVSVGRWRFEVLRVQTAYSFSHAVAIFHKVTGRTQGWVATGAVSKSSALARQVATVGAITLTLTTVVPWAALLYNLPAQGISHYWAMMAFLLGYSYLTVPLIVEFLRVLGIVPEAAARTVDRSSSSLADNRTTIYENIAVTAVLLFAAALALGWFNDAPIWG